MKDLSLVNCGAIGEVKVTSNNLSFGEAIDLVKCGYRVARAGWNGKGMFIFMQKGSIDYGDEGLPLVTEGIQSSLFEKGDVGTVTRLPCINMRSASGSTVTGWLASQTDMLSNDWVLLHEPQTN
ncbi:DUF2829 domain-containing protein [Shewanella xiamenensis]|uniref:DUF2829 domain-containing protein n=1 Tax=Shewanella xiamenensis TaxID=332186 RepID=UPI00313EC5E8